MKIEPKISNNAFFCLLFAVTIFLSVTGCYSLIKINPRPELSNRSLTKQEKMWGSLIRSSYPKWQGPVTPSHQFETDQKSFISIESAESPAKEHRLEKPDIQPPKMSRISDENRAITNNNDQAVIGRKIASRHSIDETNLPDAILDINPKRKFATSPSANEGYRIVSDGNDANLSQTSSHPHPNYTYRVKKGETLYKIARKFYGDESAWKKIFNANKAIIKNPNNLKPGTYIKIP